MTFHAVGSYRAPATGGKCHGGPDQPTSPRIAVSLHPDDFRRVAWLAHRNAVPMAEIVRRAVSAYLRSINEAIGDDLPR